METRFSKLVSINEDEDANCEDAETSNYSVYQKKYHRVHQTYKLADDKSDAEEDAEDEMGKKMKKIKEPKVPFWKMFRYATPFDYFLMVTGTIFAIVHGVGWPILAYIFGGMTNEFIKATTNIDAEEYSSDANLTNNMSNSSSNVLETPTVGVNLQAIMATYSLYYTALGIVVFIASTLQIYCWQLACERQVHKLRKDFFYQILRQEIGWFDQHESGGFSNKLNDDIERIREGLGDKLSMVIQAMATFIAGYGVGFIKGWQLTVVILALSPILIICTGYIGKIIATSTLREQKRYASASIIAEEVLSNIRTVISLCGQKMEIEKYHQILLSAADMAKRRYVKMGIGMGISNMINYVSYGAAFYVGAYLVIRGLLDPGAVFSILFAVMMGSAAFGNSIPNITIVATAMASARLVFEVIDSKPRIDPYAKDGVKDKKIGGHIQISNVNFSYPSRPTIEILKNFSVEINPGQTLALVGSSGSGKSTIVSLILRFYDPKPGNNGSVKLDGVDIKDWNLKYLRSKIGVVSQEPLLFGRSIADNIRLGNMDATDADIISAAKEANAHKFISKLPDAYQTLVGDRGAQLSGGQKQRIAIARALIKDPKILILDEATSALDAESESVVQDALDKVSKGRTTVVVAHRLSTIRNADVICALDQGVLKEQGTHEELMKINGLYHNLVQAQTFIDADAESKFRVDAKKIIEIKKRAPSDNRSVHKRGASVLSNRSLSLSESIHLENFDNSGENSTESVEKVGKPPTILKMLKFHDDDWWTLFFCALASIGTGVSTPIFAVFYGQIFQTFTFPLDQMQGEALFWSLMFVALGVTVFICFVVLVGTAGRYSEHLLAKLRLRAFSNICRQDVSYFDDDKNSSGKIATRLATDVPMIKSIAGHRISFMTSSMFNLGTGLILSYIFCWQLALALTAVSPILVIIGGLQIKLNKSNQLRNARLMEMAGKISSEAIENVRTVQGLSAEGVFYRDYVSMLVQPLKANIKSAVTYALAFAASEATIFLIYAGAFRFGAYLIDIGVALPADVYRVFFAISLSAASVGQVISMLPDYTKARLSAALVFNMIETKPGIDSFSTDGVKPALQGNIVFKDIVFRYPTRRHIKVLKGLSLNIKSGQTVALVGESGCGKSTLMALLQRFYDPESGFINIDGHNIQDIEITHLRRSIGIVSQEPVLFNYSIKDNLTYGLINPVNEETLIKVCIEANIHEFISHLPSGYETLVGERGTQLSGGQKQRIAIARALIRNPSILLLDEATSALDTQSEKVVQEAIDSARMGRTCLVIAHRLSTIVNADKIVVISDGKVVEEGGHEELLAKEGFYYRLTKKQMSKK